MDLPEADVGPVRLKKRAPGGFRIERYNVEIFGMCGKCARQPES